MSGDRTSPTCSVSIARLFNVACRSAHLVAVSALLGAVVWGVDDDRLRLAIWGALASGLGLVALEAGNGDRWLSEGRGLAVGIKLALLALMPWIPSYRAALLVTVMLIAAIGSHLPSCFRHARYMALRRVDRAVDHARVALADVPAAGAWAARGEQR